MKVYTLENVIIKKKFILVNILSRSESEKEWKEDMTLALAQECSKRCFTMQHCI